MEFEASSYGRRWLSVLTGLASQRRLSTFSVVFDRWLLGFGALSFCVSFSSFSTRSVTFSRIHTFTYARPSPSSLGFLYRRKEVSWYAFSCEMNCIMWHEVSFIGSLVHWFIGSFVRSLGMWVISSFHETKSSFPQPNKTKTNDRLRRRVISLEVHWIPLWRIQCFSVSKVSVKV